MNTKIILFDIDGVIIRPPHYFWRELESLWYKNAEKILDDFFRKENTACTDWKVDTEKSIVLYLQRMWWEKTTEVFFQEQFEFEAQFFDKSFTKIVKDLQDRDILCYFTNLDSGYTACQPNQNALWYGSLSRVSQVVAVSWDSVTVQITPFSSVRVDVPSYSVNSTHV